MTTKWGLFFGALLSVALPCAAIAAGANPSANPKSVVFLPRAELGAKAGNNRNLLQLDIFIPIAQQYDALLFTNLRFSGDDDMGREGNFGLGYRHLLSADTVIGGYGYFDRRLSQSGNMFNQATLGGEVFKGRVEARTNFYLPFGDIDQLYNSQDQGRPFVIGSNVFATSAEQSREEAQTGFDAELGFQLPVMEDSLEAVRVYGGGYAFKGDETESVHGVRFRTKADITPRLSVGASWQHDDARGSQGFLEMAFKFGDAPSIKAQGIRARLAESPVRDIDIVTQSEVTSTAELDQLVNADTGTEQRILFVDNTADAGGTGTDTRPFNNLVDAENAQQAGDIIYIRRGDGTTFNYDTGFYIFEGDVRLQGSGSVLQLGSNVYHPKDGSRYNNFTMFAASQAPSITFNNDQAILVEGDNALLDGFDINDADGDGVFVDNSTGAVSRITIRNLNINNSGAGGLSGSGIAVDNGAGAITVNISDTRITNSFTNGITLLNSGGAYDAVTIDNVLLSGSSIDGLFADMGGFADGSFMVTNSIFTDNEGAGINLVNDGHYIFRNNSIFGNDTDVTLDIGNGFFDAAQNWWGQEEGVQAGQIDDIGGAATIDTSEPLAAAP